MKKGVIIPILAFVAFLSVGCSQDSNDNGNTPQHSAMELVLNADDGKSVDFENEVISFYKRNPVLEATIPAVLFDDAVSHEDLDQKVALSAGTVKFPCYQIDFEEVQDMQSERQKVTLYFRLDFIELNKLNKYRKTPSPQLKLYFDGLIVDEAPLKSKDVTNAAYASLQGDTLIIKNAKDLFDEGDVYYCDVEGFGTLGFTKELGMPVGCPGFEIIDDDTPLRIPLTEYEKYKMVLILYGKDFRVMFKQECPDE